MATSAMTMLEPKSLIRPTHWSKEVENAYRFQLAGYRDELEYKRVRQVAEIEIWPDSGFVKKLQRRKDGFFYYFDKLRECPDKEIKKYIDKSNYSNYIKMDNKPSAPVSNPLEQTATDYLQSHRIPDLFHNLSASLVFNKPDDPKAFMIDYLEQLKKARATGLAFPALLQDTDLTSVFRMLDPVGHGHITYSQYASTMEALGITKYNSAPTGKDKDRISSETFCQEAKTRLNELNTTFLVQ